MEWAAFALDTVAVVAIVSAVVIAAFRSGLLRGLARSEPSKILADYRQRVVGGLLVGLDLLVASDVIKTAASEITLRNVGTLGLLVAVRIALTWSLVVEAEGRWPWQRHPAAVADGTSERTRNPVNPT
jgi:uncharacterized membrane protein